MSPRRNWVSPNPSPAPQASVSSPPPRTKGWGAHSPAAKGVVSTNSDDWRKSLALCPLCDYYNNLAAFLIYFKPNDIPALQDLCRYALLLHLVKTLVKVK
jgi:hypothetical protein